MKEERLVYHNGRFVAWDKATVHIMSHSFGRGSAIFEVIGFHSNPGGRFVFRLDDHVRRLFRTAELLGMRLPEGRRDIRNAILATVRRNPGREGHIKIVAYYPQVSFDVLPPRAKLDLSIFVLPSQGVREIVLRRRGVSACVSKWNRLDPRTVPIEAKAAGQYLNGMLARRDVRGKGYDYAILLDTQGFVAEGSTESVFVVRNGCLMTACLGTVLDSITRKSLLELADAEGIATFEGRIPVSLLDEAEEIFFSSTPIKLLPVRRCGQRVMAGVPGPLTKRLMACVEEILRGNDRRFTSWMVAVD
ncbi:MAG: Branched-chain-amino-acid aminotransferase [Syntrophaceae bacterium PtaU1.Bin231]|nr:MAG: Branched-chain-amino-acid aminotransferase [Syntrophaceae bacterium PtaU1.Bin231]HOG18132.1 aminotransferase class IV [Syntrophales bacterium]